MTNIKEEVQKNIKELQQVKLELEEKIKNEPEGSLRISRSSAGKPRYYHKYMNKDLNLSAIVMRKKPGYKSCKKHKIFDNLLKQKFNVDEKNKIWCTDFTYKRQPNGKFRYNCTIMDLFDRSAIASVNSDYINTELAIETLTEALKKEKPNNGIFMKSDHVVQYTSWEFVNFCKDNGVIQSMSKAGCPYDNAPMERFYITFKNCFYYRYTFERVDQI